jgi:hypothetical protein
LVALGTCAAFTCRTVCIALALGGAKTIGIYAFIDNGVAKAASLAILRETIFAALTR